MNTIKYPTLFALAFLGIIKASAQTWTARSTSGFDYDWQSVAYNGNKYLAVGRYVSGLSSIVMTSTDGKTWTRSIQNLDPVNMNCVIYFNNKFIAACSYVHGNIDCGIRLATSTDGITWTTRSVPDSDWQSIANDGSRLVAVGTVMNFPSTVKVMTSDDGGLTWTGRTASSTSNMWKRVTYGNGKFVAVSAYSPNGNPNIMYSSDGITWTAANVPSGNPAYWGLAYGNNCFVAVSKTGVAAKSTDGINWTATTTPVSNAWTDVTFGAGKFVAVSESGTGNRVMTSTDGTTWSSETSAADNNWQGISFANNLFIAVSNTGTGNRIMTSDGMVTLPVTGLTFSGRSEGKMIYLNWSTTSEINSHYFELERNSDGKSFKTIGKVEAAGNSYSTRNYSYVDMNAPSGLSLYRIKQTDENGKFSYSRILPIHVNLASIAKLSPNPAYDEITLQLPAELNGPYEYKVHDAKGNLVKNADNLQNGSSSIRIDNLPTGTYLFSLWENGHLMQQQWILKQ